MNQHITGRMAKALLGLSIFCCAGAWASETTPAVEKDGKDEAKAEIFAIVTDHKGKPIEGAVVFVEEIKGKKFLPPKKPYVMDQIKQEFVPHILPMLVGGKVLFPNSDNIYHHIYSFSRTRNFEIPLNKDKTPPPLRFDKVGVIKTGCSIHDWMRGIILVLPTPYFAITGEDGKAVLRVPKRAQYELSVYHERKRGSFKKTRKVVKLGAGENTVRWDLKLKRKKKINRRQKKKRVYY